MPVGVLKVPVDYQNQRELLDLYVIKNKGPSLMGRDWLHKICLDWCLIKSLQASLATSSPNKHLDVMLDKYSVVFEDKLGTFISAKAKLTLKEDSQACFLKARPMPYTLKQRWRKNCGDSRIKVFSLKWSGVNGPHRLCLSPRQMVPPDFVVITRSQ